MGNPAWTFGIAFGTSLLLVPLVRWVSFRTGRIKQPSKDRWHRQPTPTLGGVGMFLAFALSLILATAMGQRLPHWSLLAAGGLAFALGLLDDFRRLGPSAKLLGQLLAATLVVFFGGFTIQFFPWPFANLLLTLLWLVGLTNAINLLDNMDGLAAGVAMIAASFLAYFFWMVGDTTLLSTSLALAGAILGFLVFNFPPAKIFMGDGGSLFLGLMLAGLAIVRRTQASNVFAVLGIPVLIFLLPILDTSLVVITRLLRGQSPARGGTDHTSHRLVAFGLGERQAVLALYGVALLAGLTAAALEAFDYDLSLVLIPLVLVALLVFIAYLGQLKVVTSAETPPPGTRTNGLSRLMVNLAYQRSLFELLLDLFLVGLGYYLAYWTRFGLNMTQESVALYQASWPVALGAAYLSFFAIGVYRSIWRYTGLVDLARYALAAGSAGLVAWIFLRLFPLGGLDYPDSVFALFALYLFLAVAATRASFALLDRVRVLLAPRRQPGLTNVLIYGVPVGGRLAEAWLQDQIIGGETGTLFHAIGFLDEDPRLWQRQVHGLPVLGGSAQAEQILATQPVQGIVVLSTESLETSAGQQLIEVCSQQGVWLRTLKVVLEDVE